MDAVQSRPTARVDGSLKSLDSGVEWTMDWIGLDCTGLDWTGLN